MVTLVDKGTLTDQILHCRVSIDLNLRKFPTIEDHISCNAAVSACEKASRWRQASYVLAQAPHIAKSCHVASRRQKHTEYLPSLL